MWINVKDKDLTGIISILRNVGATTIADNLQSVMDKDLETSELDGLYFGAAKSIYESEGDLEFDDDAVVSKGEDEGAYVMCWKWITDGEAGVVKADDED
jgi:hypothetical protein